MTDPAPLFVDTFSLCEWLLQHLDQKTGALPQALCCNALQLLTAVTLALKNRQRQERLDEADECLVVLRVQLRLAAAVGWLSDSQMLFALEGADRIGRQVGGWQRALNSAS